MLPPAREAVQRSPDAGPARRFGDSACLPQESPMLAMLMAAALTAAPPSNPAIRTIGFLVLPGVYNSELVAPYDVFHHVIGRGLVIDWDLASVRHRVGPRPLWPTGPTAP